MINLSLVAPNFIDFINVNFSPVIGSYQSLVLERTSVLAPIVYLFTMRSVGDFPTVKSEVDRV